MKDYLLNVFLNAHMKKETILFDQLNPVFKVFQERRISRVMKEPVLRTLKFIEGIIILDIISNDKKIFKLILINLLIFYPFL